MAGAVSEDNDDGDREHDDDDNDDDDDDDDDDDAKEGVKFDGKRPSEKYDGGYEGILGSKKRRSGGVERKTRKRRLS